MTVSVAELKTHLRIQHDEEDSLLESLLKQVRLAILLMAAHFYEYRDSSDKAAYATMLSAFHALLYPHRVIEEMF